MARQLSRQSERLKISASAVRFRPSPPPFSLPQQGNPPYRIPDNSVQCLTIPYILWTQSGHSNKTEFNFKRKAKNLDGHKTGHNLRWYFLKIKKWVFLAALPILLLGLILLTAISFQKGIKNPHSNNPYELLENSLKNFKKHANVEITIIPEVPIFTYHADSDTSQTTFTLVLTETNGVKCYVVPTFHFGLRVEPRSPSFPGIKRQLG